MISNFGNRPYVEVIYIWKGRKSRRRRVNDLTQKRKGRGRKC